MKLLRCLHPACMPVQLEAGFCTSAGIGSSHLLAMLETNTPLKTLHSPLRFGVPLLHMCTWRQTSVHQQALQATSAGQAGERLLGRS